MNTNKAQVEKTIRLRDTVRETFKDWLGEDCENLFDNGRLCIITHDSPFDQPGGGPFPIGEWSLFVPTHFLNLLVPWFSQNRDEFTVLIHPNTGCEYEDHTIWTMWIGNKWNLDPSIFRQGEKTKEKDHTPGDKENPTCQKNNLKCSVLGFDGPGIPCCEGTYCKCDSSRDCTCRSIKLNDNIIDE